MKPKRKRGRPPLPPDYLYSFFWFIEEERKRTGLSVSRTCEFIAKTIAKSGPLQFVRPKTGETVEIKKGTSAKTLRSRYQEVLTAAAAARTKPTPQVLLGIEPHELREQQRTLDGAFLVRQEQPGRLRILGFWGPTKKDIRQRRKKLHNK